MLGYRYPLILRVKASVVDRIHLQNNKFATVVESKAAKSYWFPVKIPIFVSLNSLSQPLYWAISLIS